MSSALVKVNDTDNDADYLSAKLTSSDSTVSLIPITVGGKKMMDIKAPGGGSPADINLGLVITDIDYTLDPALKNVILVTDPNAVITLPVASSFQEAVEYIIKDASGTAGTTNIRVVFDGGDSFEGGLTNELFLTEDYQCVKFISDLDATFYFTN